MFFSCQFLRYKINTSDFCFVRFCSPCNQSLLFLVSFMFLLNVVFQMLNIVCNFIEQDFIKLFFPLALSKAKNIFDCR